MSAVSETVHYMWLLLLLRLPLLVAPGTINLAHVISFEMLRLHVKSYENVAFQAVIFHVFSTN
jgi:hypothetical protein